MEETISAAEANRNFSRVLREVREDRAEYVVTVHGKPVAKILPIDDLELERAKAREALFERLRSQPAIDIGHWTRDELYDETE
jgi:prevent-host-death family protein